MQRFWSHPLAALGRYAYGGLDEKFAGVAKRFKDVPRKARRGFQDHLETQRSGSEYATICIAQESNESPDTATVSAGFLMGFQALYLGRLVQVCS